MIRNHPCWDFFKVCLQPLSLMKTTFYNHAPVQMQIYVDCLFRLELNINLYLPRSSAVCLERDEAVTPAVSLLVLWSGMPIKMTGGAFHRQQLSAPLLALCWSRGGTQADSMGQVPGFPAGGSEKEGSSMELREFPESRIVVKSLQWSQVDLSSNSVSVTL